MEKDLWHVRLSAAHPEYQQVSFRRSEVHENYQVVVVDAKKLIHYSDRDIPGYVIAPVEQWDAEKRKGIAAFLAPPTHTQRHVEMPIVSFNESVRTYRKRYLWLFTKTESEVVKYVSYTNGRHRTRYLIYAGATEIPVLCHNDHVAALREHCSPA